MFALFVAQVGGPDPGWVGALGPERKRARVELGFAED